MKKIQKGSQVFYESVWRGNKMEWSLVAPKDIRKAELDEIVPNRKYWKQSHTKPYEFYECVFHPTVNWSTIEEMAKRIYVEN